MTAPASPTIPFNRPHITGSEADLLAQALASGHLSGDGPFTRRAHQALERLTGAGRALLTTSCTHALEMAALLLRVGPGDEVVVPSFTFVSTANAFALRGARVVFADVRPDTLNLDEGRLEQVIGPRTRAVLAVHYAGVACAMDALTDLADARNLTLIEDNAHGLFGRYRGRPLGGLSPLATQSFHDTKNITSGEGGALLISRPELVERAEIIREKGTNRSRFFRGQVDKYTWVDLGSSYLPSELCAAVLCAQLDGAEEIQRRRIAVWERYQRELGGWAERVGVVQPTVPEECEHPAHLYYLLMPSLEARTRFIDSLRAEGIQAVFHYQPLHLSDMGRRMGGQPGDCPVTERVADTLVRLPLYADLSESDQARVIDAVRRFT